MNMQGWPGAIVCIFAMMSAAAMCIVSMLKAPALLVGVVGIAGTVAGGIFGSVTPSGAARMRQSDIDLLMQVRKMLNEGLPPSGSQAPATRVVDKSVDPTLPIGTLPIAEPSPVKGPK